MSKQILFQIPVRTVSEANVREHWAARHKRSAEQRELSRLFAGQWFDDGPPAGPITVKLTRLAPRELDGDNLQRALKAVRDGVADALGVDDRDSDRLRWTYGQRKQAKEYSVEVEIQEASTERTEP